MQIVIVLPNLESGGAERVMISLANGLCEFHSVDLVVLSFTENNLASLVDPRIKLVYLGRYRVRNGVYRLRAYLACRPDAVVVSTLLHLNIALNMMVFVFNSRHRLIVRETNSRPGLKGFLEKLLRFTYLAARRIVYPSVEMEQNNFVFRKRGMVVRNPFVYRGITDNEYFDEMKTSFLLVGSMTKQKNFSFVLDVIAESSLDDSCHFHFVGDGPLLEDLKRKAISLGLNDLVTFHGYCDDVQTMFYHADVYILSSLYEGMPNVLLEALSFGCMVISADIRTGVKELVEREPDMHLYPSNDKKELLRLIERYKSYKKTTKKVDLDRYSLKEFVFLFNKILLE